MDGWLERKECRSVGRGHFEAEKSWEIGPSALGSGSSWKMRVKGQGPYRGGWSG